MLWGSVGLYGALMGPLPPSTIVVEPGCEAELTALGDIRIAVGSPAPLVVGPNLDPVLLSLFSHRFMSIAGGLGGHGGGGWGAGGGSVGLGWSGGLVGGLLWGWGGDGGFCGAGVGRWRFLWG